MISRAKTRKKRAGKIRLASGYWLAYEERDAGRQGCDAVAQSHVCRSRCLGVRGCRLGLDAASPRCTPCDSVDTLTNAGTACHHGNGPEGCERRLLEPDEQKLARRLYG